MSISARRAGSALCGGLRWLHSLNASALAWGIISTSRSSWCRIQETDALLVGGGDALYLCHWMRQSGLVDLLPSLREKVYVGVSGGSMVMGPNIGEGFAHWKPSPKGTGSCLPPNPRGTA